MIEVNVHASPPFFVPLSAGTPLLPLTLIRAALSQLGMLAAAFIDLLRPLCTAGFAEAIQREEQPDEEIRDTAFWIGLAFSLIAFAVTAVIANFYAAAFNAQSVALPMVVLAGTLVISALGRIHIAIRLKGFEHKSVTLQSLWATTIAGVVAVAMAWYGAGVWALVVQTALSEIITTILAWYGYRWVPRLHFDRGLARRILVFSSSMILTQMIWSGLTRIPDFVIGKTLGVESVGIYRIAWRLIDMLGQATLAPVSSVAFLALARAQSDPAKFEGMYVRIVTVAVAFCIPAVVGFGLIADTLMPVLFGQAGIKSIPIAEILSLSAPTFIINYFIASALGAKGKPHIMTQIAIVQIVTTYAFSVLAVTYGLAALTAAYVLRGYLTLPYQQFLLQKYANIRISTVARSISHPLLAVIAMFACLSALKYFEVGFALAAIPRTALYIFVGFITYSGALFLFGRQQMLDHYRFFHSIYKDMKATRA